MANPKSIFRWPVQALTFMRQARDELKKVAWPSREATVRYTLIVTVSSVAVGVIIGGFDYVLTFIVERFLV